MLDREGCATRFAFMRNGGSEATRVVNLALRQRGVTEATSITVLTGGDAGLGLFNGRLRRTRSTCWIGSTLLCDLPIFSR